MSGEVRMSIKINFQENKYFVISQSSVSAIDLSKKRSAIFDWINMNNGLLRNQYEDTNFLNSHLFRH
jgi:hypothetical protein